MCLRTEHESDPSICIGERGRELCGEVVEAGRGGETFSCVLFTDFSLPGVGIVSSAFLCKWCGVVS